MGRAYSVRHGVLRVVVAQLDDEKYDEGCAVYRARLDDEPYDGLKAALALGRAELRHLVVDGPDAVCDERCKAC